MEKFKTPNIFLKIKRLDELAEIPFKHYDDDFCYDVVATSREEIAPNIYRYGTGIALQLARKPVCLGRMAENGSQTDEFALPLWVASSHSQLSLAVSFRPRSSIWKTGLVLSNSVGTIDEGYTGEITAVFYHVMPSLPIYKVGDRIGQIYVSLALPVTFREVGAFRTTLRGYGGYGSTGL